MIELKFKIFRFDPTVDTYPTYKTYEVNWEERGNAIQLLKQIYEEKDKTLAFPYYACGFKFCNGCMMTINGKVTHACRTPIKPGEEVLVEPMAGQPVIKDLVVDFGITSTTPEYTFEIKKGTIVTKR